MAKTASRAKERRQERERQRRRNRQITLIAVIGIAAALLVGLLIVSSSPAEAPIPEGVLEKYDNITRTTTSEGYPRLGEPDAPVRVVEYSSFSCPACASFHDTVFPQLLERVREGEINFTFVPLQIGPIPNPGGAARAALCAGEQGLFWEYHDVLFDWHTRFGNTAFSSNRLTSGVSAMGLDAGAFNQCFNSDRISAIVETALLSNISSTPSITVNDVTVEPTLGAIESAIIQRLPANFVPISQRQPVIAPDVEEASDDEAPEGEATQEVGAEPTAEADGGEAEGEETAEPEPEATTESN